MTLAIIPCSKEKIWDDAPQLGAVAAREAYCSPLYRLCLQHAEQHADRYVILSAKYGFLAPSDPIPGTYDVTFSRPDDPVVTDAVLRQQASAWPAQGLLLLLPARYEARVRAAVGHRSDLSRTWPFEGMNDFDAMMDWLRDQRGFA